MLGRQSAADTEAPAGILEGRAVMRIRLFIAVFAVLIAAAAVVASPARHAAANIPACEGYEATVVVDDGESYNGTSQADVIVGLGNNVINANGGNDIICAVTGWNTIHGNSGNDQITGVGYVSGDSGNDAEMLTGNTLAVVVGNHSAELEYLRGQPRIHFAAGENAWGIVEGIEHYDFLGALRIPEEAYP